MPADHAVLAYWLQCVQVAGKVMCDKSNVDEFRYQRPDTKFLASLDYRLMEDTMKKLNLIALFACFALLIFAVGIGLAQVRTGQVITATENMPLLPNPPSQFLGIRNAPISTAVRGQRYRVLELRVIKALPNDQTWIKLADDRAGVTGWALLKAGN